jgi:chromosome segregation ATPase
MIEELQAKVDALLARHSKLLTKKASLGGLLEAKKQELSSLKKEIEAAGLDPKRLKEHRDTLERELREQIETFDIKVTEVEKAFAEYDAKRS